MRRNNFDILKKHLKSVFSSVRDRKSPSPRQLVNSIKNRSHTGLGGFVDINNDLELLLEENREPELDLLMPYFYAKRIAAAGMFCQGALNSQDFEHIDSLFCNFMAQSGNNKSTEEQVELQEQSLDSALELIGKYVERITRQSAPLLIEAAKRDISVRNALLDAFSVNADELAGIVEPIMYSDYIQKEKYCAGFFATGWWQKTDDFESTSEKLIYYLTSIGVLLTAADTAKFINSAGQIVPITGRQIEPNSCDLDGPEFRLRLNEYYSIFYELAERPSQKTHRMTIMPVDGSHWSWDLGFSKEEADLAQKVVGELYDYAQGWIQAQIFPTRKSGDRIEYVDEMLLLE